MMLNSNIVRRLLDHALGLVAVLVFAFAMLSGLPRLRSDSSIRIATALLPPQMGSDGLGREADIITAALRAGGVSTPVEFHVMPFTRHWQSFKADSRFHGVTTVPDELDLDGLRSDVYIRYQNGVIYRASAFPRGLGEPALAALAGKRIIAFAGAAAILPGMRVVSENALMYLERKDQLSHSIMFAKGVADAVVADELIFAHYTREYLANDYPSFAAASVFDPVFCPTAYRLVLRDDKLRDAFNIGLTSIRASGVLGKIEEKYAADTGIKKLAPRKDGC
jgi:polar amino acid transport system substrate-binding protein